MKLLRYDETKLGVLSDEGVVDLTGPLDLGTRDPLREYLESDLDAAEYENAEPDHSINEVDVNAPIRRPGKIIAASANYPSHIPEGREMLDESEHFHLENIDYFLKAPSSIVDPGETIELPFTDMRTDHEVELAFVVGRDCKNVSVGEAWEYIYGYSIMIDVSIRGKQDRSNRKSYDTFSPFGPTLVTADEFDVPPEVDMRLRVNGETRQESNTRNMINGCAVLLSYASISTTVEAGDVVATGTPGGVSPLAEGDTVEANIEGIGDLSLDVVQHPDSFEDRLP